MKKLICLLLALALFATMFVACDTPTNDGTDPSESTADGTDDTGDAEETTEEDEYVDPIDPEDLGINGRASEVNMLVRANRYYYLWMPDGTSTDTVERAVFARNDDIEVRFNVEFAIEECESSASAFKEKIKETSLGS